MRKKMRIRSYSKVLVLMLVMVLVVFVGLTGCDSGGGGGDEFIPEEQEYDVNVLIEDVDEAEVGGLRIHAAGETYDQLEDYHQDGELEYTLTLTEDADISVTHEDDMMAFTPQAKSVDSSDDNIGFAFRKGKYAENIEMLGDYFADESLRAIVLAGDIDFNEVDEEVFDLGIERDLIIDGQNEYSIKGDGMMIIEFDSGSEASLTFKNISFEIGNLPADWNQENDPKHVSKEFIIFYGDDGKLILENVNAIKQKEIIDNFIVADLLNDSQFIIKDSNIDLDTTNHLIDINNGGNAIISGNKFAGEEQYIPIRILNRNETDIAIEDNEFSELDNYFMFVGTHFTDNNVSINNYTLEPVSDVNDDEKVKKFADAAFEIHKSFGNLNNMSDKYRTIYDYGDINDQVESIDFVGSMIEDVEIEFKDENLEQAVRDETGRHDGPIYKGYVDNISHLETNIGGIESLEGIEYFESLEWFYINAGDSGSNKISDLSPLFDLDNLYSLMIRDDGGLSDISQLENIDNLERLLINHNHVIEDFSPLSKLNNLNYLNLGNTGMNNQDLEHISDLTNLEELFFWDNNITDISPVKNLVGLRRLIYGVVNEENDYHNKVKDISPVKELNELRQLHIPGTGVENIESVRGLHNLNYLNIANNEIGDFSPIENLTDLIYLYIHNTGLKNLNYFINYSNLNILDFSNNEVVDISPLSDIESWNFEPGNPEVKMINNDINFEDEEIKNVIDELKSKGIYVEY